MSVPAAGARARRQTYVIAAFPLSGPAVYQALLTLYGLMALYSFGATATGVQSIDITAGFLYGRIWPLLLLIGVTGAIAGMVRTRYTGRALAEFWSTLLVVALLIGFMVAIVWRFFITGDARALPASLLPIGWGVLPYFRLRAILKRPHGGPPATPRLDDHHRPVAEPVVLGQADGDTGMLRLKAAREALQARQQAESTSTPPSGIRRPQTGVVAVLDSRSGAHDAG